ncbi:MAG: hypothetical protein BMS9Abin37_3001 [Acidobacteriota bacterium]|nr:MAG: hypothetical protein BMS9Abin37_3001 [Acidobacteriota bacterium]
MEAEIVGVCQLKRSPGRGGMGSAFNHPSMWGELDWELEMVEDPRSRLES